MSKSSDLFSLWRCFFPQPEKGDRLIRRILSPRTVEAALKEVGEDRKCFRQVGGVLVERTVKEILPALSTNREQVRRGNGGSRRSYPDGVTRVLRTL